MEKEERLLEQVRNLLARAEHPNTPEPEADLCRERANTLMARHAIDEALLRAAQPVNERRAVAKRAIKIEASTELTAYLRDVAYYCGFFNRCRVVVYETELVFYGFSEDIDWAEMLYTAAYTALVSYLHPKWDESLGYDANVYNHKVAGMKWHEINRIAMNHGHNDLRTLKLVEGYYNGVWQERYEPTNHIKSSILTAYRRHARLIGDENPVATQSFEHFRRSYCEGFSLRMFTRLHDMQKSAEEQTKEAGAELVLHDAMRDVDEAFYADYPSMRPMSDEEREARREAVRKQRLAEEEARNAMLDAMTEKQRAKFLDKEFREQQRQDRRSRANWKPVDQTGSRRGQAAADQVNLARPGTPVNHTSRKEIS